MGTRHFNAGDEARLHAPLAKNLHGLAHPSHPVVPPDARSLSRIDPFEEPLFPHLHVEVDVVGAGGFVPFHLSARPGVDFEGNPWFG